MSVLPALPEKQEPEYATDSPAVTCAICGTQKPSCNMINFAVAVPSPGHPDLLGVGCPVEHWACSLNCWQKVAHACIDEHMLELLKERHQKVGI